VGGAQRNQFVEEAAAIMIAVFQAYQQTGPVSDVIVHTTKNSIDGVGELVLRCGLEPYVSLNKTLGIYLRLSQ